VQNRKTDEDFVSNTPNQIDNEDRGVDILLVFDHIIHRENENQEPKFNSIF